MTFPPELQVPRRDELRDLHLQFRKSENPDIDVSEGGEPWIDARVKADTDLQLYAYLRRVAHAAFPWTANTPEDIAEWGEKLGVSAPDPTGATGLVQIVASVGGANIPQGLALTIKGRSNGTRYQATRTGLFTNGQRVTIAAIDTGVETNLPVGTVLVWQNPPSGLGPTATVVDLEGEGLTGGHDGATPEEHKKAYLTKMADPAGGLNDAHFRLECLRAGIAVQQAFSYPAVFGPGTTAVVPLVFPSRYGGSRKPTGPQLTTIGNHLNFRFGADDSIAMLAAVEQPTTIALQVDWSKTAAPWADGSPWPAYGAAATSAIVVKTVTDALTFQVGTANNSYTGITAPAVGQRFAVFDASRATFYEKRIKTVSGTGPWDLTIDTTNSASDETYAPVVGSRLSPWSDSLEDVARAVYATFLTLGPGEMIATPPEGQRRQRREPEAPTYAPSKITQAMIEDGLKSDVVPSVKDRALVEGDGAAPSIPLSVGSAVYLLTLGDLAVFPKS